MNEKAVEYTDVLNARLNKVQQDFDQQLISIDRLATENTESSGVEGKGRRDKRAETGNTAPKCNGRSHPEKAESH